MTARDWKGSASFVLRGVLILTIEWSSQMEIGRSFQFKSLVNFSTFWKSSILSHVVFFLCGIFFVHGRFCFVQTWNNGDRQLAVQGLLINENESARTGREQGSFTLETGLTRDLGNRAMYDDLPIMKMPWGPVLLSIIKTKFSLSVFNIETQSKPLSKQIDQPRYLNPLSIVSFYRKAEYIADKTNNSLQF